MYLQNIPSKDFIIRFYKVYTKMNKMTVFKLLWYRCDNACFKNIR